MNEESRPARRLSDTSTASKSIGACGGQRTWEREVKTFSDKELILVVRSMVAVDRAVNTYRENAASPTRFEVPAQ